MATDKRSLRTGQEEGRIGNLLGCAYTLDGCYSNGGIISGDVLGHGCAFNPSAYSALSFVGDNPSERCYLLGDTRTDAVHSDIMRPVLDEGAVQA